MRYVFSPFVLDIEARQLTREGRPVALTPRAFALLATLLRERPRALDRVELAETLWPGTWVGSTSLAQLVSEVRKVLHDDPRRPTYLRTVHRHGYAFCGAVAQEGAAGPAAEALLRSRFSVIWEGRQIGLDEGENVIGRDPTARVHLPVRLASRQHARIVVSGGDAVLEDLASKNGTFLWGQRLEGPVTLHNGDKIGVGDETLVFWSAGALGSTESRAEGARDGQ